LHLGYQRWPEKQERRWILRRNLGGKYTCITLGRADDVVRADGKSVLNYAQALAAVRAGMSNARDVPSRWADFIARGITPACYLYRHYDYQGDLLYVGLSNSPVERQRQHREGSHWAALVCTITIEPFATREEVIAAEQLAIETEFPKYNQTYNGRALPRAVMAIMEAG